MVEENKNEIIVSNPISKRGKKKVFLSAAHAILLALVVAIGLIFLLSFIPNEGLSSFLGRASEGVEKSVKVLPACSLPYPVFETEFTDQKGQKLLVGWGKIARFEEKDDGSILIWVKKRLGKEIALMVEDYSVTVNFNSDYSRYFILEGKGFKASKIIPASGKLTAEVDLDSLSVGDCLKYYFEPQASKDNKVTLGKLVEVDFLGVGEFIY